MTHLCTPDYLAEPAAPHLTPREQQCVTLAARGYDRAQTALDLGIAVCTVDERLKNARRKLGATSTTHLVALAIAAGHIPADTATGSETAR